MALSENLASVEPWIFRAPFTDSWISESFARDNETLTKALEKSLCSAAGSDSVVSFSDLVMTGTGTPTTPTASNVSGSDLESPAPKRQRNGIPVSGGKVSKRKSRASKRSQTTFITADPANFRQMVQQVTGVRFGNAQLPVAQVLKPEPQRAGSQLTGAATGGFLPTLDTSAFLLDHHQQNVPMGPSVSGVGFGPGPLGFQSSVASNTGSAALDFETYASFPTLDSWK
ncbi:hypothetical protein SLEP1_g41301 [Rubroshorea leprosula]|uniref:VQ domain-containing protein n=1 Tax=Rubroshorea leprosula TaxID=152421 RepID=A0AAV5L6L7_9ROSI|nr:hypothetical protein SLEP1_g41301 [Rubroshorea leprosula]